MSWAPLLFQCTDEETKAQKMKRLAQRHMCVGHPQDCPQIQGFAKMTHRTQHVVILMAMIYYTEKIQSN